jgi:hypothetical protein
MMLTTLPLPMVRGRVVSVGWAPRTLPPSVAWRPGLLVVSHRRGESGTPERSSVGGEEPCGHPGTAPVSAPPGAGPRVVGVCCGRVPPPCGIRCRAVFGGVGEMGSSSGRTRLEERVVRAAEQALADHQHVTAIDVLLGLGWLAPSHLDRWRQGRVAHLEGVTNAGLGKISSAMQILRRWARDRGLEPSETVYVARTRDRRRLRFSVSGDPDIERSYRTHWVDPELSERKRQRVVEQASKPPDLVVIAPLNEWTCTDCGGTGGLLIMEDAGPLCLVCADLNHLVFLPAGDAALTRRARKASGLSAVVVRFSRARKRYERQGVLVEEAALEEAERQCLEDADARARRREREAERRAAADEAFVEDLTAAIRQRYPGCPPERAHEIAQHTAVRGSGRIGRTAAGRDLDPEAIDLAVTAAARHRDTGYDALLMAGTDRHDARDIVHAEVAATLDRWRAPSP